ncbi:MAG: hypothetical protein QNJ72_36785 [Pleurocapsa sp. MO_226.B13]|nr:hypothetical protein [Pleurocapsa sp. MO_226.B13]
MSQETPQRKQEKLSQLSKKELVEIIQTQIETIEDLKQEIEKLKISRDLNSQRLSRSRLTGLRALDDGSMRRGV